MNEFQRRLVLLVGMMSLLTVVFLFVFVYAPNPAETPALKVPEPYNSLINQSVQGLDAIFSGIDQARNFGG